MIIGFTGTQRGMSEAQKREVKAIITKFVSQQPTDGMIFHQAHHGDCIGADAEFNELVDNKWCLTYSHPASDVAESKKAHCQCDDINPAKPALIRNHDIVYVADLMIACPGQFKEAQRSGTWATIRYARKCHKPLIVISPDGTIMRENVNA
jgi:hypothetical protein